MTRLRSRGPAAEFPKGLAEKQLMRDGTNSVRVAIQTPHPFVAKLLGEFRKFVGGDRFSNLYVALSRQILAVKSQHGKINWPDFVLLDYGCGNMNFSARLRSEGLISAFVGMDTFPAPKIEEFPADKWIHYRQVPEKGIDENIGRFDATILIDVLHHVAPGERVLLLKTIAQVSPLIIIKDHFEYGAISRQVLRLADWFGNYAYGVNVPKQYFDESTWSNLVTAASLTQVSMTRNVRVHDGLFGLIVPPRSHFFAVLSSRS